MKNILIILCFIWANNLVAQKLNSYKYVLVPEKFEFLKEPDQYRLNRLTHYLFNKYGFNAFLGKKNVPKEAINNNCMNLFVKIIEDSNMFTTKLAIQLRDCKDNVVYTSPYGESKHKVYKVAYNQAIRQAGANLKNLNYKYSGSFEITENNVKQSKEEIVTETKALIVNDSISIKEIKDVKEENLEESKNEKTEKTSQFFAQKRQKQGWLDYNIVDEEGVLYFVFYSTGKPDIYLVEQSGNLDKMLCFKKDGFWHLVSRDATKMGMKVFDIQFPE